VLLIKTITTLIWAPDGPGWPHEGGDWYEAQQGCQYLSEDGLTLATSSKNNWRLPTVDEAVQSMPRHGQNSSGVWDAKMAVAVYEISPSKESKVFYGIRGGFFP
jgi:hypothetical protein